MATTEPRTRIIKCRSALLVCSSEGQQCFSLAVDQLQRVIFEFVRGSRIQGSQEGVLLLHDSERRAANLSRDCYRTEGELISSRLVRSTVVITASNTRDLGGLKKCRCGAPW